MARKTKRIEPFPITDATGDSVLRECSAKSQALNTVFGLPAIVRRHDTQHALTLVGRSDRLFELADGSLWHLEWQGSRDADMFKRMMEYWVYVRNEISETARIHSTIVLVGNAPRNWAVEDWVGDTLVPFPVVDFRKLDVTPLFERGNVSDMMIGLLGREGTRPDRLEKAVREIASKDAGEQPRLLSILGRMMELRGETVSLPPGVMEMIEAIDIDYARNPVFKPSYEAGEEAGVMAERRRTAVTLLGIAFAGRTPSENERAVASVADEKLDQLIAAATNLLRDRSREAEDTLDLIVGHRLG